MVKRDGYVKVLDFGLAKLAEGASGDYPPDPEAPTRPRVAGGAGADFLLVSHTTLWRLKKGKALGINFETLEKICRALGCQPGDVMGLEPEKKRAKRRST
jgi:putative transcriptional regulator